MKKILVVLFFIPLNLFALQPLPPPLPPQEEFIDLFYNINRFSAAGADEETLALLEMITAFTGLTIEDIGALADSLEYLIRQAVPITIQHYSREQITLTMIIDIDKTLEIVKMFLSYMLEDDEFAFFEEFLNIETLLTFLPPDFLESLSELLMELSLENEFLASSRDITTILNWLAINGFSPEVDITANIKLNINNEVMDLLTFSFNHKRLGINL